FPLTDFQKEQCGRFWKMAISKALLALFPLILMAGTFIWIRRSQERIYKHAQSKISHKSKSVTARVSHKRAGNDLFSWVTCLRPVHVAGESGVVYLSPDAPVLSGTENLN